MMMVTPLSQFPIRIFPALVSVRQPLVRAIMGTARVTRHNRVVHCTLYSLYSALYTRGPDSCTPPGQSFPVRDVTSISEREISGDHIQASSDGIRTLGVEAE